MGTLYHQWCGSATWKRVRNPPCPAGYPSGAQWWTLEDIRESGWEREGVDLSPPGALYEMA